MDGCLDVRAFLKMPLLHLHLLLLFGCLSGVASTLVYLYIVRCVCKQPQHQQRYKRNPSIIKSFSVSISCTLVSSPPPTPQHPMSFAVASPPGRQEINKFVPKLCLQFGTAAAAEWELVYLLNQPLSSASTFCTTTRLLLDTRPNNNKKWCNIIKQLTSSSRLLLCPDISVWHASLSNAGRPSTRPSDQEWMVANKAQSQILIY